MNAALAQTAPRRTGSITGRVTAGDGAVLSNARVICQPLDERTPGAVNTVLADEEGNFSFHHLVARSYNVSASLPGYTTASDDSRIRLARIGDSVSVRLVKGGVITGRITDASGEPVVNVGVSAQRVRDEAGQPAVGATFVSMPGITDDRGIYRLYGLAAGAYLVVTNVGLGYPGSPYQGNVPIYYPANTRDGAVEVQVQHGSEASHVDIQYRAEPGQIISGKVTGAVTGQPGSGVNVRLTIASTQQPVAQTFVPTANAQSGFELPGVANGDYDLVASRYDREGVAAISAPRRVSVRNANVGGLELALAPLASITGKFVIEPPPPLKPDEQALCVKGRPAALNEIVLSAQTPAPLPTNVFFPGLMSSAFAVAEDGAFKLTSLEAGIRRLQINLPGESWYVKSIVTDARAATHTGLLSLKPGENLAGVTVTLAVGAAQLSGKLAGQFSERTRVHLVPTEAALADEVLRYAEAVVRSDGTFALTHLAPGKYWLLAKPLLADENKDGVLRPLAWNTTARAALRKAAEAGQLTIELAACMRLSQYNLKP